MRFIRLKKKLPEVKKPSPYIIKKEIWKFKNKKGKKKKITVRWHYFKGGSSGYQSRFVFLRDGLGLPASGRWHLMGFDLKNPQRFIAFYDKKVAKQWAKKHKFKIVKLKRWKKKFKNVLKKKGKTWPQRKQLKKFLKTMKNTTKNRIK